MADFPPPPGYTGSEYLPKSKAVLKNCWNTGAYILPRPGIASISTKSGTARGSFVWNGSRYVVVGNNLLKIEDNENGDSTTVGTISGTDLIDFAIGFNHAVIVVRALAGKGYTLDATDTLTEITDSNFVASNSVTHINGRFVYIPYSGDPAFFSDVGAGGTIQAESFFDAEELPDKNKVAFNWRNTLVIGGTDSLELFRDIGISPVPYQRLNARQQHGYIGGIIEYADTFAFIGREKDQDAGIYALSSGTSQKISNEAIDTILAGYLQGQLEAAVPARFKWRGYDVLTYTLQNHSFGYVQGNWHLIDTRIDNEDEPWRAGFVTYLNQTYYTASARVSRDGNSSIGKLAKINTDYGNPFNRVIEFGYYNDDNNDFTAQSVEIGISQGYNASATVGLQLSRDNVTYSEPFFRATGDVGDYSDKLVWNYPGGLGYYEGFMGIRLMTAEDVEFAVDKFTVNER